MGTHLKRKGTLMDIDQKMRELRDALNSYFAVHDKMGETDLGIISAEPGYLLQLSLQYAEDAVDLIKEIAQEAA